MIKVSVQVMKYKRLSCISNLSNLNNFKENIQIINLHKFQAKQNI